ncbi:hypothetical protein LSAT2_018553 [Lamellibrachia satsuma]|nr:hypothetical protein LSAT2_018553 [Lamellibrachia satsuma]
MRLFVQCRRPTECARRDVGRCRHAPSHSSTRVAAHLPQGYGTCSGSRRGLAPVTQERGGRLGTGKCRANTEAIQRAPFTYACSSNRIMPIRTNVACVFYALYIR